MKMFLNLTLAVILCFGSFSQIRFARAEISSDWVDGFNSRARLVAGTIASGNLAGLEISLTPGWKTYWRNPGEGGIAPEFNWQGSQNVRDIQVLFPVPNRYTDESGTSIGYKDAVTFPVVFLPVDPLKPIILKLNVDYAVCEKLCIPAHASIVLHIPGGASLGPSANLIHGISQVPQKRQEADAQIIALVRHSDRHLDFDILFQENPEYADVFAEGPKLWFLPAPKEINRGKTEQGETVVSYRLNLDGLPKETEISGKNLKFTIIGGAYPVEQNWRLE